MSAIWITQRFDYGYKLGMAFAYSFSSQRYGVRIKLRRREQPLPYRMFARMRRELKARHASTASIKKRWRPRVRGCSLRLESRSL